MKELNKIDKPFTAYMQKVIPLAFNESLSYYEQLCLILNYIKNKITPSLNTLIDEYSDVVNSVEKLEKYIDDYFNSEDFNNKITTAIDTKLNAMANSGELENIITAYLKLNALICFDTIPLMKASTNLTNGSYVKTYGSNEFNNKKGAFYKVRTKQESDVVDEVNIIELNNNLVAILILQDDFDSLQTQVNNLSDNLNTTNQKVTELETGLNTTNTNVSNNTNRITTLENNLNTTNNKVSTLETQTNNNTLNLRFNSKFLNDEITTPNQDIEINSKQVFAFYNENKSIMQIVGELNVKILNATPQIIVYVIPFPDDSISNYAGNFSPINVYKNNGSNMYESANASAYVATIKKPSSEPLNPNPIQLTISVLKFNLENFNVNEEYTIYFQSLILLNK